MLNAVVRIYVRRSVHASLLPTTHDQLQLVFLSYASSKIASHHIIYP
jgi:hypothetical protein